METEFHVGPDKIIYINGEDKLSSWLHVRNLCAVSWNPPMPVTVISDEDNEKSVQAMEQAILDNSQVGKVRSASTLPSFAIDIEKVKKNMEESQKKKHENESGHGHDVKVTEGGSKGGHVGSTQGTTQGGKMFPGASLPSGGGVGGASNNKQIGSPIKHGVTTTATTTTTTTKATTTGDTGHFSPALSLLSPDDMSASSSVASSVKPTPLQGKDPFSFPPIHPYYILINYFSTLL